MRKHGAKVRSARVRVLGEAVGTTVSVIATTWFCIWLMPFQDVWALLKAITAVLYTYVAALQLRAAIRKVHLAKLIEETDALYAEMDSIGQSARII